MAVKVVASRPRENSGKSRGLAARMTFRERIWRTFQRKPVDRVVWQPRIYYWYRGRRQAGTMPARYLDNSMLDIYDDLNASPRYPGEVLDIRLFKMDRDTKVRTRVKQEGENIITVYETPVGNLRQVEREGSAGSGSYLMEYPVKCPADMKTMTYILDHTRFRFDREAFQEAERLFGHRGITQAHYSRSPFQRLVISYMGFENTIYALNDYPHETEAFMKAIEAWDDRMYEVILGSPLEILNFGENIDARIASPRLFQKYLIPYYRKRVRQVHAKGKFCHIHMDGALKSLLPLINEAGFDGIEAATPLPQGDVTLEELKEAMGDTILLDGIPAILFLPRYTDEELEAFARRVLELFAPNLILGISDELPPPADIEKVRLVSRLVETYQVPSEPQHQAGGR